MLKLICVKCQVAMKPEENGIIVAEMYRENTEIYRLWQADLMECPLCQDQIVAGFGQNPIAQHFDEDLEEKVKQFKGLGRKVVMWYEPRYLMSMRGQPAPEGGFDERIR